MNRTVLFFLVMLAGIGVVLVLHPRVLAVFESALLLDTCACFWFLATAFFPARYPLRPHRVLRPLLCALLLLFNVVALAGVRVMHERLSQPVVEMSKQAPAVEWKGFGGDRHSLAALSGRAVVIHFWATWCGPCRREFPDVLAFAKTHPGIVFLTVDVKDDADKAQAFVAVAQKTAGKAANVLYAFDPDSLIYYDIFKNVSLPSSLVIDPQGRMRRLFLAPVAWNTPPVEDFFSQWPQER